MRVNNDRSEVSTVSRKSRAIWDHYIRFSSERLGTRMAMVVRLCDEFGEHSCFAWVRVKSVLVKEEGCGGFVFLVC